MNNRELARNKFKDCGITYKDIKLKDIYKLIQFLNFEITKSSNCILWIIEPKLKGKYQNVFFEDDKLRYAELRVKGTYFDDREAITFNEDGFVGIGGWCDKQNIVPLAIGFSRWCDYMINKDEYPDEPRGLLADVD